MEAENPGLGRRFSPQNMGPTGSQSRFRYGIHFSNAPADIRCADVEAVFSDFGPCRVMMDPGAQHGWVGYDSIRECNNAFEGMNPNLLGMYIRKGPYEAGPIFRPPMGGPPMGSTPMGGPPMGSTPMGGPQRGVPMIGGPPRSVPMMGGPMIGGQYPRHYGPPTLPCGPRRPPMGYYGDDYYNYYGEMPYDVEMPYGYLPVEEMCSEVPGCAVGPCTWCGVRTSYSCERCGAFYCSERCQRQDWSAHRESCDRNIPGLNFGPRNRGGKGDIIDLSENMRRLPITDRPDGRGDSDRPSDGAPERGSLSGSRPKDNELSSRTPRSDAPDDERSDNAVDRRRSNDQPSRSDSGLSPRDNVRQPSNDQRRTDAFSQRTNASNDRRPNEYQRRADGDLPRRNENDDRRPTVDRHNENGFGDNRPVGDRRNGSGFGDRRGDGERHSMGERGNDNGFGERRFMGERGNEKGFGERRSMGERGNENGFGERRPMGERGNENGFGERRPMGERGNENGFGDRRGNGERRPMGERQNNSGFGDRRGDNDRRPMRDRRGDNDRRNGGFSDRRFGGNESRDRKSGSPGDRPGFGQRKLDERPESFDEDKEKSPLSAVPKRSEDVGVVASGADVALSAHMKVDKNEPSQSEMEKTEPHDHCIKLKVNDPVIITQAVAMDCIHVTPPMLAYSEEFNKVFAGVAAHCENAPVLDRAPVLHEMVACQFVDDKEFYRAVVKEVLPGGEYVMEFCDFGNVQRCKTDKLKSIPDDLKKCPRNAVKVSLCGVSAVPFTGEIHKFFEDLIYNDVKLKLQFDGDISKGVELIMPNGDSVNKEVTSLIGRAADPVKKDAPVPKTDTPALSPSAHVKPRSSEQVLASLLTKAKLPEPQAPTTLPAEEGVCTDLKNDELVIITASTNTGSTYITKVTESSELINLSCKLNEHCKTAPPLDREPRENEVVGCLYDFDKLYYRAAVSEVLPNREYIMVFCDYGNCARYKLEQLKAIPNELKMLPWQAVKVYFRDVDPVPVSGPVGEILGRLSNESTQLKLQFNGSIENGVELLKPDGKSLNEELRRVIAQAKPPQNPTAKAELAEDFSPSASVPLPTDAEFTLLVFGILGDLMIAACSADATEIAEFEETYAPQIAKYCKESPEKEHRPAQGDMCLAKFTDEWYRALTLNVEADEFRDVFFVDYGNTHRIPPTDIRKIPNGIRSQLHTLTVCTVVGNASVDACSRAWAEFQKCIQSGIDEQQVAVFSKVKAKMTGPSSADVNIPDFQALL